MKRTPMAHPIDNRSVDEYMADGLKDPQLWVAGFLVAFFAMLFLTVILLSGPAPQ